MERRPTHTENDDWPRPWEDRQITRSGWIKHRTFFMTGCCGWRPEGWWLYEHDMEPPPKYEQGRLLFEMGELKGAELKQCLDWWRMHYKDGHWENIPPALLKQWGDGAVR